MLPQPQYSEDLPGSDSNPTHISFARIQAWRHRELNAGRPSGLLDFYRSHGFCIACQASGSKPLPADWHGEDPIFDRCDVCGGTGKVRVS
jgi:excinuclease UvrABC ATPase subunit